MNEKLYKKSSMLALLLVMFTSSLFAQDRTVSGTVKDSGGNGLPGVNVVIKGTANGTTTDADGKFSVSVSSESTLVFSFIGFATQEIQVGSQTTIDVVLAEDTQSLEEIVVIGYGEQKKSLSTGAISSVKAQDIQTMTVPSIDQAMQGRVAGVNIVPTSGQPGSSSAIRIRGAGSSANSNPLFIIDGVRSTADGMNFLSPADIASIEILKDAASAAIYGADGANGVVIVTTKKGKPNTAEITYTSQIVQQSLRPSFKLMNQNQYLDYLEEANVPVRPTVADITDPKGTDWIEAGFDKAPLQSHTLNFSGGTEKSTYFVSGSYYSQKGIVGGDNSKFDRYTFRINTSHKIKDWLTIGENFSYNNNVSKGLGVNSEYGGVIGSMISLDPLTPTYFDGAPPAWAITQSASVGATPLMDSRNGKYFGLSRWITGEFGNPLMTYYLNKGKTVQNKVLGNVFLELTPIKFLKFTSRFGVDAAFQRFHTWNPSYYYSIERYSTAATGQDTWNQWFTTQWENFATYDRFAGDHHFSATAGTSMIKYQGDWLGGTYTGFFKEQDKWSYPSNVPPNNDRIDGSVEVATLLSYFGRINYEYKDKYLFNATLRRDGSSKLAEGNQWGTFPSVSLGWIASNEDFFSSLSNIIDYSKVRLSWGQNGSLSNIGIGQWKNSISNAIAGPIRYANAQGAYLYGAAPTQAANPNLTWETSQQLNIGADFRLLDNKMTFGFDWFNKTTKDLVAPGFPPMIAGIGIPYVNAGSVENKGIELELGYGSEVGSTGLKYSITANFTSIKNEVTKLNPGALPPTPGDVGTHWGDATRFTVGDPVWSFWGYKTGGIFQDQTQIDDYVADNGLTGYAPVPGDPIVLNTNGDNLISPADFVRIGQPHPTFYYGTRINLNYKGFDFLVFLQGQGGNDILMGYFRTDRGTANKPEFFYTERWTPENNTNDWFRPSTSGTAYTSDYMITKGDFAKIRQLQLGYSLPSSVLEKVKVKNLRLYVSLDNFFVFTKYKGFDPEVGYSGINQIGVDRGTYPVSRRVVGGLTLTF
jgi:TonB-linked SusC/RagA family outer membrane protein